MIWAALFLTILLSSLFLAYRSMKNYQEKPLDIFTYSLFLIRSEANFNKETLKKLHRVMVGTDAFFSIERLFKGDESALALYIPSTIIRNFPELSYMEIEDYLDEERSDPGGDVESTKLITKGVALPWVIAPKNSAKKLSSIEEHFLSKLDLDNSQRFFWQVISHPNAKTEDEFQVTIRAMVVEKDPAARVDLAKRIDRLITQSTGLIKETKQQNSGLIFESFAKRTLVPSEVAKFTLTGDEILELAG